MTDSHTPGTVQTSAPPKDGLTRPVNPPPGNVRLGDVQPVDGQLVDARPGIQPTGRKVVVWAIANCVALENEIFQEHVIYNNSSLLQRRRLPGLGAVERRGNPPGLRHLRRSNRPAGLSLGHHPAHIRAGRVEEEGMIQRVRADAADLARRPVRPAELTRPLAPIPAWRPVRSRCAIAANEAAATAE